MEESDLIAITSSRSPKILLTFVLVLSAFTETNGFISADNGAIRGTLKPLAQESKPTDVRELRVGAPIERELAGGEAHSYRVTLTAGQYLHVEAEQKSIDVVVRLFGPDGQKLTEVNNDRPPGSESIFKLAGETGAY